MTSSIDIYLCLGYLLAWIITFIWYHIKRFALDAGSVIIGMQIIYAIFSVLTLTDELFSMAFEELHFFPYLYLYSMMMIAIGPIIYDHIHPTFKIAQPHTRILSILSIIIIATALIQIPDIVHNASTGVLALLTDTDAGKNAYDEQVEAVAESGKAIRNLPAIIYNALSDLIPFILFYFLTTRKKNHILITGLLVSVFIGLMLAVSRGQRGGIIISFLTAVGAYFLFRRYISRKINILIQGIGITCILLITVPVIAITISRFGKKAAGVGGYVNWYIGQGSIYFNNYGLDAGGTRNGERTFNLVKRLFDSNTPKNFVERREKYSHLKIEDYFFTTVVGGFTRDFGPYIPVAIFLTFSYVLLKGIRPREGEYQLHQVLLLYFAVCISLQGGMTLFSYSDSGNLRIVMFGLLYGYLRYHKSLLERYPLLNKTSLLGDRDDSRKSLPHLDRIKEDETNNS